MQSCIFLGVGVIRSSVLLTPDNRTSKKFKRISYSLIEILSVTLKGLERVMNHFMLSGVQVEIRFVELDTSLDYYR
jgi:hypothetical protein